MPQPSTTTTPPTADTPYPEGGLSAAEAARRLQADGPNALTPSRQRTLGAIMAEVAREPMFQLLAAAGALYLVLGDVGEAAMLLAFVCLTVLITVWQGLRTERALAALRDLTSPRALVVRDGQRLRIAGREVVRGDLLVLSEGDRIAADARVLSANDLRADESLLTGEAVAVSKLAATPEPAGIVDSAAIARSADSAAIARGADSAARPGNPDTAARPGGEGQAFVYAGTLVVGGQGLARVLATGPASEIGRIGQALGTIASPATPLNLQTRHLVRVFSVIGLTLSVAVVGLYGASRGDWIGGLLAGITLAMSMLPQEFPLILTVFMAMGAWRLSRQRVLTRRPATIEALGAATVLCTDKTGTLTQNRMTVMALAVPASTGTTAWDATDAALPAAFNPLLESGLLASERDPFDAMDQAFGRMAAEHLPASHTHPDWTLVQDYGLSPTLPAMTHVWQVPGDAVSRVAVKGAQEAVLGLCRLPEADTRAVTEAGQAMAARGLRVLAVACGRFEPGQGSDVAAGPTGYPSTPQGYDFEFLGLVGLADPLQSGVIEAVQDCRNAGIRVVMITGDHPATARAIATQAGLDGDGGTLTGADLAALDDAELRRRVAGTTVYARVLPEQKLRIVQALQASGEVVAMTGDGVNDAPSLKAAHIGIAMGGRGTDVAREAASLVLLDDDFGSIVAAVRLGRRIYDNLRKAMAFVFAVHVPIAGLSLMPLLFGLPLVFTPVHIVFLELLIDPVCSIVFESEPEEGELMARPPRDPATPLFSRALIASSLAQGGWVLLAVGLFFVALLRSGVAEAAARGATFTALVGCSVALILVNRSLSGRLWSSLLRPNPALWRVLAATAALLAAVLLIAPLRSLFRFAAPTPELMAAAGALVVAVLLALQGLLWLQRRPWRQVSR